MGTNLVVDVHVVRQAVAARSGSISGEGVERHIGQSGSRGGRHGGQRLARAGPDG